MFEELDITEVRKQINDALQSGHITEKDRKLLKNVLEDNHIENLVSDWNRTRARHLERYLNYIFEVLK